MKSRSYCFSFQLPNETEIDFINHTKVENCSKIAIVSYGGIFRAPYIAEVLTNWTMGRGVDPLVECEAFGVADPSAFSDTDPTVIHLLTSQKILYRGKPLAIFKQETIEEYDFIVATDKKSWFALRDLAPERIHDRIELLSMYDPHRRVIDMPDIFFTMHRKDRGRKLRWVVGLIAQTVSAFMNKHIDDIKYRAGITTTTTTGATRGVESIGVDYHNEYANEDINAEFDYTVPSF